MLYSRLIAMGVVGLLLSGLASAAPGGEYAAPWSARPPAAPAPRVFHDYARVLHAEPILAPAAAVCREQAAAAAAAGDAQAPVPALPALAPGPVSVRSPSIAAAILHEAQVLAEQRHTVAARPARCDDARRVTGWEVLYEYAGRTYRRIMREAPGDRMRVRVEHAPGALRR